MDGDEGGGDDANKKKDEMLEMETDIQKKTEPERRIYQKIYYDENVSVQEYKVVLQRKASSNVPNERLSISKLQVGDILYRKMKIGEEIEEIRKIGRNKIIVKCKDASSANKIVDSDVITMMKFEAFIPYAFVTRTVVIKNVDIEFQEDELKEDIQCGSYKIMSVKRMNRRHFDNGQMVIGPSQSIKLVFNGCEFPRWVYLWGVRLPCEPFIPPLIQCFLCQRYNHTASQCKGKKVCRICGNKDSEHECANAEICCNNCKGDHRADSQECPEKKRQKAIKEVMGFQNITYMEAAAQIPRYNEVNLFSAITKNSFDVLENYDEEYPEMGIGARKAEPKQVFEPYKPTAASRRRMNNSYKQYQQTRNSQKRSRSKDNSPENDITQIGKKIMTPALVPSTGFTPRRTNYPRPQGYEFFRQDRNYSKYEQKDDLQRKQQENKKNEKNSPCIKNNLKPNNEEKKEDKNIKKNNSNKNDEVK